MPYSLNSMCLYTVASSPAGQLKDVSRENRGSDYVQLTYNVTHLAGQNSGEEDNNCREDEKIPHLKII